jgi:HTH-type transcriptional regulator/antitoxin HipB
MVAPAAPSFSDPDHVGRLVARVRRRADLSQRDLAARVGLAPASVARIESGTGLPSLATLSRILELSGLRLAVLDSSGQEVEPVPVDGVRDNQGRRFPAHLDVAPPDEVPYERWAYPRYDRRPARGWYGLRPARDRALAAGPRRERPADHPTEGELETRARLMRGPQPLTRPPRQLEPECSCPDACFEELCIAECTCQCEPRRSRFVVPSRSIGA